MDCQLRLVTSWNVVSCSYCHTGQEDAQTRAGKGEIERMSKYGCREGEYIGWRENTDDGKVRMSTWVGYI